MTQCPNVLRPSAASKRKREDDDDALEPPPASRPNKQQRVSGVAPSSSRSMFARPRLSGLGLSPSLSYKFTAAVGDDNVILSTVNVPSRPIGHLYLLDDSVDFEGDFLEDALLQQEDLTTKEFLDAISQQPMKTFILTFMDDSDIAYSRYKMGRNLQHYRKVERARTVSLPCLNGRHLSLSLEALAMLEELHKVQNEYQELEEELSVLDAEFAAQSEEFKEVRSEFNVIRVLAARMRDNADQRQHFYLGKQDKCQELQKVKRAYFKRSALLEKRSQNKRKTSRKFQVHVMTLED